MASVSRADAWKHAPIIRRCVLGIDPGEKCGATLAISDGTEIEILWSREVDVYTHDVEALLEQALITARTMGVKLTIAIEEWGRGGPLGLVQWIGLGQALGAWRRAAVLLAKFGGYRDAYSVDDGIVRVGMSTWRGAHLPGVAGEVKKEKGSKAKTAKWKQASTRRVMELWPDLDTFRFGSNAAESALIAETAMRDLIAGERIYLELKPLRKARDPSMPKAKKRKTSKVAEPEALPIRRRKVVILAMVE